MKLEQLKEIKHINLTIFKIEKMLVNSYYIDLENNLIGYVIDRSRDLETIEEDKEWQLYDEYNSRNNYNLTSVIDIKTIGNFDFNLFTFDIRE